MTVTDDGPGVTPEALPRLFDRFFREDESRSRENGGSGLGLSIVAAIVRSHGGRILAAHAAGGGLTMTVVLPRPVGTGAVSGRGTDPMVGVTTGPIDLSAAPVPAPAASSPGSALPAVAQPAVDASVGPSGGPSGGARSGAVRP